MYIYILNLIDLLCTLYVVSIGVQELNPFMQNIPAMITYKVFIVGLLLWWLSNCQERIAKYGLRAATFCYGVVDLWHMIGIFGLLANN